MRRADVAKLEKEVQKVLDSYDGEREERVQELRESLERRVEYLQTAKQTGFSDEDHLWADALDINIKKLSDEEREKLTRTCRKVFESDIADTEAYIEDAAERMRRSGTSSAMKPKDVITDETALPRAEGPLRLAVRLRRVLPRRHGREPCATCSSRSTSTPSARARGPGQDRQGPEAGPRGQAAEGRLRLHQLRTTSPR